MRTNRRLVLISIILLMLVSIPAAFAYFSTFTQTKGDKDVHLKEETKLTETMSGSVKVLTVEAENGSYPVYVRAKAFYNSDVIEVAQTSDSTGWNKDGDYYYYTDPIDDLNDTDFAKATNALKLNVNIKAAATKDGDELHVVVIYEAVPAIYDEKTDTWSCEWPEGGNS